MSLSKSKFNFEKASLSSFHQKKCVFSFILFFFLPPPTHVVGCCHFSRTLVSSVAFYFTVSQWENKN